VNTVVMKFGGVLVQDAPAIMHSAQLVVQAAHKNTRTVAARLFTSLASENINLLMIAQGSSEVNISVLIAEKESQRAVRAVHAAFGLAATT